ncbi:hypothetical protein Tco_1212331 [Tanacetum coccineum]
MTHSSTESKTSLAMTANLSELELKKNLYKALVEAYKSYKLILDTYGDTVSFKKRRDDEDKDEPFARSNRGSKRRRAGKEPESTSVLKEKTSKSYGKSYEGSKSQHKTAGESTHIEEPMHTTKDLKNSHIRSSKQELLKINLIKKHLSSLIGFRDQQNFLLPIKEDPRESFNELMDNPLDFLAFLMNRLKVDTLTPELLAGPTFELMKGSCKSQQYPHDLRKPLPLIPNSQGRRVIPFDHFINNDLEYLSGGGSSRKYATSVTKTKAADYGHIKWIEDLVPNIIKKTENQAKMTKLSMEWKRLCKIKAKVQKCQSQSQYRRISSQTGAGTEEYCWMQS